MFTILLTMVLRNNSQIGACSGAEFWEDRLARTAPAFRQVGQHLPSQRRTGMSLLQQYVQGTGSHNMLLVDDRTLEAVPLCYTRYGVLL